MAQSSGFFNALQAGGVYDRLYNADDYSSNMGAIISTGVRRSGNNDLRVTANGLQITVAAGRAWIEGRWYYNDSALELTTVTPPTGTLSRADGVYLQLNSNVNGRTITLVYKTGQQSASPAAPACTRTGGIYEIMLASVAVAPGATAVTVTDTRPNASVCGWVTSPVGYDDYWQNLDAEFNEWFTATKDTVASVTLFKQYFWNYTMPQAATQVSFNIPQYDPSGTDILNVYTNGLLEIPGVDYRVNVQGDGVTSLIFTEQKQAGTEIVILCYKSIDGTGLGSVSGEITALQNQVAALGNMNEFYYFCNGSTDNVQISTLVQNFLNGSASDGRKIKIHICGTFGVTAAVTGAGSTADPFRWFNFAATATTNRRVALDFCNCSPVDIQPQSGTFNNIFYGDGFTIEGLTLTAGAASYSSLHIIGVVGGSKYAFRDCNISITGAWSGGTMYWADMGDYSDSKIVVINYLNSAAVFSLTESADFVRIVGGYYSAYTGSSSGYAAGIYTAPNLAGAAVVATGAAFPRAAKESLSQTNAARINSGYITAVGLVTPLPITTTSSATANIYGTITLDKD